jgi:hypothetical protein
MQQSYDFKSGQSTCEMNALAFSFAKGQINMGGTHLEEPMAEPTYEELKAKLAELEKQQGTRRTGSLEFRVGEKGGVSVYGLGRFPVTLYYEQWIRLLDSADKLREFLEENKSKLKLKG